MESYSLKTKNGEQINVIKASDIIDAIELFAKIKLLSTEDLLKLFTVELI